MTHISRRDHAAMAMSYPDLPFGEQLTLWGVRMWVRAFNQGANIHDILHRGFELAGVPEAHGALDAMMGIFSTAGKGAMDVRCPQCTDISFDEHRILGAIAAWQVADSLSGGDAYLSHWMPPAALRILRGPVTQLADTLARGGLHIRLRPWARDLPIETEQAEPARERGEYLH